MDTEQAPSRRSIFVQASANYYAPYTRHLSTVNRHRNFGKLMTSKDVQTQRFTVNGDELRRFSIVQVRMNAMFSIIYIFFDYYRLIMLMNYLIQIMD